MSDQCFYHLDSKGDLILRLRIQPRASSDQVYGHQGNVLKIRISAPPVEGRANTHLLRFLSKELKVRTAQLSLSGERSRDKTLRVSDLSTEKQEMLQAWCRSQSSS